MIATALRNAMLTVLLEIGILSAICWLARGEPFMLVVIYIVLLVLWIKMTMK